MVDALEFHPLANLFPLIEGAEFDELVADIREHGIQDTIDLYQGKVLDGRNRYRAAIAAGVELERRNFRHFMPELWGDPLAYVLSKNLRRRHLDDGQRASVAAKIANFVQGGDRSKPPIGGLTAAQAATTLNVAPRQVERARVVHDQGVPELREALDRGEIAVSAAERIARMDRAEQEVEVRRLPRGARAIMGSREEPEDSLDYFPTPPWATRALMERVWPVAVPSGSRISVWEPACGEGHIAEVLREYFPTVLATDIHDYGYGESVGDFLDDTLWNFEPAPEWIITNPPFNDAAEQFVLRSLDRAGVGVAMFLRLQWLESVGRYERIFSKYPPSMIAQFCERVPLHKERWEPKGATATAYLWIIWMPERQAARGLTEFFWIPPGCREALTKPDDVERFTAHPVIKKDHPVARKPDDCDPATGEIIEPQSQASENEAERGAESPGGERQVNDAASPAPALVALSAAGAGAPLGMDEIPDFLRRRSA